MRELSAKNSKGCSLEMRQHQGNASKGPCKPPLLDGLETEILQAVREITFLGMILGKRKGPSSDHTHWPKEEVCMLSSASRAHFVTSVIHLMVYKPQMFDGNASASPSRGDWSLERKEHLSIPAEYTGLAPVRQVWQSVPVRGMTKWQNRMWCSWCCLQWGAEGTRDADFQG